MLNLVRLGSIIRPMIAAFDNAVGGLRAASVRAAVAADNIANIGTTRSVDDATYSGFVPTRAVQTSGAGGPQVTAKPVTPPFINEFNPSHPDANGEGLVGRANVDLAANIVELKQAEIAYKANAQVLRTAAELTGHLLDATA